MCSVSFLEFFYPVHDLYKLSTEGGIDVMVCWIIWSSYYTFLKKSYPWPTASQESTTKAIFSLHRNNFDLTQKMGLLT